jgi:hypothetical protein
MALSSVQASFLAAGVLRRQVGVDPQRTRGVGMSNAGDGREPGRHAAGGPYTRPCARGNGRPGTPAAAKAFETPHPGLPYRAVNGTATAVALRVWKEFQTASPGPTAMHLKPIRSLAVLMAALALAGCGKAE